LGGRKLARRNREREVKGVGDKVPDANWRHDLKNQLGVIVGYAELIQQRLDQSNPLRSEVDEIMRAAQHALMLVRKLESAE
jgi:light-regulated signal transduction histidine kinase (bacteriophytochrome)